MSVPACLKLVLRDRTGADGEQVLHLALGDLVDLGLWTLESRRRGLKRRSTFAATGAAVPADLPAALAFVHDLLGKAVAARDDGDVVAVARWFGRSARRAGPATAKLAVDDLVALGLLERVVTPGFRGLRVTPAGEAVLADVPAAVKIAPLRGGRRGSGNRTLLPEGFGWASSAALTAAFVGDVGPAWAEGHALGVGSLGGPHGSSALDGDGGSDGGGSGGGGGDGGGGGGGD